jgi:hypothetical protein
MLKAIVAAFVLLLAVAEADGQVHRIAVDVTVQRCTALTCKISRQTWAGTAVAIGRHGGREYLLTCQHLFEGGNYGTHTIAVRKLHNVTITTSDAGSFVGKYVAGRDTKGTDGVDLALIVVESKKAWESYDVIENGLPPGGAAVTVEGFPSGRWRRRGSNVTGYTRPFGLHATGNAQTGESGGAIVYGGKLAAILWGSRAGLKTGTFGTHGVEIAKFVRGNLGKLPGEGVAAVVAPTSPTTPAAGNPGKTVVEPVTGAARGTVAGCTCPKCTAAFAKLRADLVALTARLAAIEGKPSVAVPDVSSLHAEVAALRGLVVPVRIETSDGKVLAVRRLGIVQTPDGLELKPIVLKFDEKVLRGGN